MECYFMQVTFENFNKVVLKTPILEKGVSGNRNQLSLPILHHKILLHSSEMQT